MITKMRMQMVQRRMSRRRNSNFLLFFVKSNIANSIKVVVEYLPIHFYPAKIEAVFSYSDWC